MEKLHAYKKFDKDLKDGDFKNVFLFYGKEQYLAKLCVNMIAKKYVSDECRAFDFFEMDSEKVTFSDIEESCETLSMFSEKRVVVLPDFPLISGGKSKNIQEADEKELIEYIKKIPESCILVITSESVDKRKKLYKEIVASGNVYDFAPLDERNLKTFVEKRFNIEGKKIKASVLNKFIRQSGYFHKESDYTLYNLLNEVKKISAHAEGDEVMLSDVLEVVSGDIESNIFGMIEAAGRNKKDEAFRLLYNILGSGGSVFHVLALLASQFEIMLSVKEMSEERKTLSQMQSTLGIHEYRIKKASEVINLYSEDRLKDILASIYQVDRNVRTGIMEQVLALEVMLSEI